MIAIIALACLVYILRDLEKGAGAGLLMALVLAPVFWLFGGLALPLILAGVVIVGIFWALWRGLLAIDELGGRVTEAQLIKFKNSVLNIALLLLAGLFAVRMTYLCLFA